MTYYLINLHFGSKFEISYLKNKILRSIDYIEISYKDLDAHKINNNLIVIYSGGVEDNVNKLKNIIKITKVYLLIHLSDETFSHDLFAYKYAHKIIRNYYNPKLNNQNILTIPIGYKNSLERKELAEIDIGSRIYSWSFMGTMKNDRYQMIKKLNIIKPNYQYITESFSSPDHLNAKKFRSILLNSIFTPCPAGYFNFETFRILEALENYSIPVFKRRLFFNHLKTIYKDNIFLTSYSWRGVCKKMIFYLENPKKLEKYYLELFTWYENYLSDLSLEVESFIKSEIDEPKIRNIEKIFIFEILLFNLSNLTLKFSNLNSKCTYIIKNIIKKSIIN